jgi:hypothetical protein
MTMLPRANAPDFSAIVDRSFPPLFCTGGAKVIIWTIVNLGGLGH